MTLFEIIFIAVLSLYFIHLVVFSIGASKKYPKVNDDALPSSTVIVAARNEEDKILECITSLDKMEFPEGKLEIILVNDHSTDRTGDIISEFIKDKPKFKLLVPEKAIGSLKGKTNALANAIKFAAGEIILTTDADCNVNPLWAKTMASYYQKDVAFVGGFTTQEDKTSFGGMQAIDFLYLLTIASGALNLGKPLAAIGNNMSYRKSVYDEIGGYENIPFSITEDFRLLMAIWNLKKYKCIYPIDQNSMITSKACPDFPTLFWQKKRWAVGGMESDFISYLIMVWGYISKAAILLTPLFFSLTALYLCIFKIAVDYFFVKPVFNRLRVRMKFSHFIAFEIYYTLYVLMLPFIVLPSRKVKWKGRTF
ncbi:MAG: family 2 glycosyl transferase [Ignavibacteria bacterium]|nr:MAG: family 2 glycosyl transferase [Ignavibacteria bacterium]KAF0161328.1 MAG: family 2 glycosyl transferase [Ignavibacteria bacterium]